MPRKAFLADLDKAKSSHLPNITAVEAGEDSGTFSFIYMSHHLPESSVIIQGEIPEVSDYPTEHDCFLFINPDQNPPPAIPATLVGVSPQVRGRSLLHTLTAVATVLDNALDPTVPIEISDNEEDADEDNFECDEYDDDEMFHGEPRTTAKIIYGSTAKGTSAQAIAAKRVRSDLRAAKRAGFKVGILGNLNGAGIVVLSIRMTKLGISEEAMRAWGLRRRQYLVLMIRFLEGYQTIDQVQNESTLSGRTQIRVGMCEKYKPSFEDATTIFTHVPAKAHEVLVPPKDKQIQPDKSAAHAPLEPLFIGGPINDLFRDRFPSILKYRLACAFPWSGAELFYDEIQGKNMSDINTDDPRYRDFENMSGRTLPAIVLADTIQETISGLALSFPLAAMQFLLRHFVRCTDFCLVCHCRVDGQFEALKPFVCSKPLCLYQYMALGFGPSIGWEIITQPYTIDLLVSFAYVSATHGKLKDFPTGVGMRVPLLPQLGEAYTDPYGYGYRHHGGLASQVMNANLTQDVPLKFEKSFSGRLDRANSDLLIESKDIEFSPVRAGDWLVVQSSALDSIHYRVAGTVSFPIITLDGPGIFIQNHKPATTKADSPSTGEIASGYMNVDVFVYDYNFDELGIAQRRSCIAMLLDTLPGILKLREHLMSSNQGPDPQLRTRRHDLSEAALNLLRWIIASNRSCIMQVDKLADKHAESTPSKTCTAEDRVSGMDDYMQFRFAMGAPDKEQRFINCVNEVAARTKSTHPTLFAWHGSPIGNWHSIIREGLHFNDTSHGRAYGHGVYMSPHVSTSLGYSSLSYAGGGSGGASTWPNSELKISSAISLNEVVNAPTEFVSQAPHYVVAQLDYIQTRYLFVTTANDYHTKTPPPSLVYAQDPTRQALGSSNLPVVIPITAVSKSRRPVVETKKLPSGTKKAKTVRVTDQQSAEDAQDDADSVVSDLADREYLDSDMDDYNGPSAVLKEISNGASRKKRPRDPVLPLTDFVPGTLDFSKLQMLQVPQYANPYATKQLSTALRELVKLQNSTKSHELGWYIDSEKIENLYQWIIELHSFDKDLLLASDMKKAGLTSVILEMRFTANFPFSPPFVRVVSPRFLPFLAGGGGHVTAGGAICMELLTNNGWLPTNAISSVLLQIRMAISSTDPRPARLENGGGRGVGGFGSYAVSEAIAAFKRACATHGWEVPKDIEQLN